MPEQNKNYNDYFNPTYLDEERWMDYWCQIKEVSEIGNSIKCLEIGCGNKIVTNLLSHFGHEVVTLDINKNINPDIVGSVLEIPLPDDNFDVIVCAEVLEHLPYEKFSKALSELHRVTNNKVILSLPHWGRHFSLQVRIPFFKKIKWQKKINILSRKHNMKGEHFWEIGKKEYPLKLIKKDILKSGFHIEKDYIAFDSPYHHFFILKK